MSGESPAEMRRLYRWMLRVVGPPVRAYSRVELIGRENLPHGGVILAANHSGSLWWDAFCLSAGLAPRGIRFVANPWDFRLGIMRAFLNGVGALEQAVNPMEINDDDSVVRALRAGQTVCHFPEQAYHTLWRRYTLFKFVPHTLCYAQRVGVPIVPTAVVGVEEAAATLFGPKWHGTPMHIPLLPPIVLPLKIRIEFGKPRPAEEFLKGRNSSESQSLEDGATRLRAAVNEVLARHRKTTLDQRSYLEHSGWW